VLIEDQPEPQKQVSCLRCNQKLERYHLTRFTALANGPGSAQAMLVCPHCGHVEFIAEGSSLLSALELASFDGGDDD
jgi:hypothetical protein